VGFLNMKAVRTISTPASLVDGRSGGACDWWMKIISDWEIMWLAPNLAAKVHKVPCSFTFKSKHR
jgi:hypothetical protein